MNNLIDAGGVLVNPYRMSGYDGATFTKKRKQKARITSRAQDEDRLVGGYDRQTLRLECLHLRRNNAIVAGVCERFADNVAGPDGVNPQCQTSDPDWNELAEQFWSEWSKIADARGLFSFREIQRLAIQSRLHSGEVGFVLLDNGQLQAVEPDRLATPFDQQNATNIIEGVELASSGRPSAFYICDRDRYGYVDNKTAQRIDARDYVHVFRPIRFDQLRGVPDLSPVINVLGDQHDLNEAILLNARLNARRSAVITTDSGAQTMAALGPRNATARTSDSGQVHEAFGDEILTYYLNRNEDVKLLGTDTPGASYTDHNVYLLKLTASALSLPYEFLTLDFSQGSGANNRAALLQTHKVFNTWQSWLVDKFLQRIWNWRIAKAIKAGELPPAPIDERGFSEWYKVDWQGPEYGWTDPQKESAANLADFKMGSRSLSDITRKSGKDAEDVLRQKGRDLAAAVRIAAELNAEHGTSLTWRDLIDVAMPGQNAPTVEAQPTQGTP